MAPRGREWIQVGSTPPAVRFGGVAGASLAFETPLGAMPLDRAVLEALAGAGEIVVGDVPDAPDLAAAARRGLRVERLDLRNSADSAGGRSSVVGYGAWAFVAG